MTIIALDLQPEVIALPPPEQGATDTALDDALWLRRCERRFRQEALPPQTLSSLLWAGCGFNRRGADEERTVPTSQGWQEIEVYVLLAQGAYRYEPRSNHLLLVQPTDLRDLSGPRDLAGAAPLNLVYVADFKRTSGVTVGDRDVMAGLAAGCIAQNVSLACAARSLGTALRSRTERRRLAQALRLNPTERIVLAQTVGWPALN